MKVKSKKPDLAEGDLTPMIDMTFQLIAFFMVLINFSQTESNERVVLPSSQRKSAHARFSRSSRAPQPKRSAVISTPGHG